MTTARETVNLILDTDFDTDCDDVGALAVLHALRRRGEVNPLAVVCSVPIVWAAACAAAVNEACGQPDLPVGLVTVPGWDSDARFADYRRHREAAEKQYGGPLYNEIIGKPWLADKPAWKPEQGLALYRRLLSEQPDGSVTICAIGTLTAPAQLLDSPPDEHSPLCGEDLVRAKVAHLVTMAEAAYPEGADCFNWAMDKPASARVVNDWPGRVTVSFWGREVLTGGRFSMAAPPGHPAGEAYVIHRGGRGLDRSSWDQVALLYAVRGGGELLEAHCGLALRFDAGTGQHQFTPLRPGQPERCHLQPLVEADELASIIEELMIEAL